MAGSTAVEDARVPSRARIAAALLAEIRRGDYGHGGKLPSEGQLCEQFGASRGTVRDALRELELAEEIESRPRFGWYVRGDRRREFPLRTIDARPHGGDVWRSWCQAGGLEGRAHTTVTIDVPEGHIRDHLDLAEDQPCTMRHRLREVRNAESGDWEPWMISTSYWPLWLAEGTDLMRTGSGDAVDLHDPSPLGIAAAKGYTSAHNRDVITARPGQADEVRDLALPTWAYVLTICRTSCDQAGTPFRVTHDILDCRRFRLTMEDTP